MSKDQRDAKVRWVHPFDDNLVIVSARTKHNRRFRAIVAQDGDQILREWWPNDDKAMRDAKMFISGYRLAKVVFSSDPNGKEPPV